MRDIKKLTPMTDDVVTKIEVAYNKGYDDGFKDGLKEKHEVLSVGDEVFHLDSNYKSVVTAIKENCVICMSRYGTWWTEYPEEVHRTGNHYPEIAQVLAALGGDQDDEV